jgi:hypothetical protein
LAGLRVGAADVNGSATVTSSDALLVNRRFSGTISSFAVGNWISENPAVAVSNTPATQNLKMLAYGDVNGSYIPSTAQRLGSVMGVEKSSEEVLAQGRVVRLPLSFDRSMELGAISLEMILPEGLEIIKVEPTIQNGVWSAGRRDGMWCFGWFGEDGYRAEANRPFAYVTLGGVSAQDLALLSQLGILLGNQSEVANLWGDILVANLRVPQVAAGTSNSFKVYPNPAKSRVQLSWSADAGQPAQVLVRDLSGRVVMQFAPFADQLHASLDLSSCAPGTYTVEAVWNREGQNMGAERVNLVVQP